MHMPATHGQILKPHTTHQLRVIEMAAINYHWLLQRGLDGIDVGAAKFLPLGHRDQRIGVVQTLGLRVRKPQVRLVAIDAPRGIHGDRVVGDSRGAAFSISAMTARLLAPRMPSVLALKAKPHSAKCRPCRSRPGRAVTFLPSTGPCAWLADSTALSTLNSMSAAWTAEWMSALTSLGKHETP